MEKYEKFMFDDNVQELLKKYNLKQVFDDEKQLYSIVSTKENHDKPIVNYDNSYHTAERYSNLVKDDFRNFVASVNIIQNYKNNENYNDYDINLNDDYVNFSVEFFKSDDSNKAKRKSFIVEPYVQNNNTELHLTIKGRNHKIFDTKDIFNDVKQSEKLVKFNQVNFGYYG